MWAARHIQKTSISYFSSLSKLVLENILSRTKSISLQRRVFPPLIYHRKLKNKCFEFRRHVIAWKLNRPQKVSLKNNWFTKNCGVWKFDSGYLGMSLCDFKFFEFRLAFRTHISLNLTDFHFIANSLYPILSSSFPFILPWFISDIIHGIRLLNL